MIPEIYKNNSDIIQHYFFLKKINSQGNCSKGFVAEPGWSQSKTVSLVVCEGDMFSPTVSHYPLHAAL